LQTFTPDAAGESSSASSATSTTAAYRCAEPTFASGSGAPHGTASPATADGSRYPPILEWFTFHEGRHTHSTWMVEDGVPEVARRARLGQKMKGIAGTYDHVTEPMHKQILDGLEARWRQSINALRPQELVTLLA
jgi:hypothetical protein